MDDAIKRAAEAVANAEALALCAGAGMGVDSGLPDFRGNQGFWKAYPPLAKLGVGFMDMANPGWFFRDPTLAWGFYGHRMHLYRDTVPHDGFSILRRWGEGMAAGCFTFTSNVDGQFQKAGFSDDAVEECHGTIHHLQCTEPCTDELWSAEGIDVEVDMETMRAAEPLPCCSRCGAVARPNVLMFGDGHWIPGRSGAQSARFSHWLRRTHGKRAVVVECGAGTAVPTVRYTAEDTARRLGGTLIRINIREPQVPEGQIGIAQGARETLQQIDALIG